MLASLATYEVLIPLAYKLKGKAIWICLSIFEQFIGDCPRKGNYFSPILFEFFGLADQKEGPNELKNSGRNQEPER
jgi:hypothetical protein